MNGGPAASLLEGEGRESPVFKKYRVTADYHPPSAADLPLARGDVVEVLDNGIDGRWFVRTMRGVASKEEDCGWIPSSLLERLQSDGGGVSERGDEEQDGGTKKRRDRWVQITAGPLSGSSDEEKWRQLKQQTAFGSHDLQSQAVISALKRVTFGASSQAKRGGLGEEEEEEEGERGRGSLQRAVTGSPRTTRSLSTPGDYLPPPSPPHPSSPHPSPLTKRRATDAQFTINITPSELKSVTGGTVQGVEPNARPTGIDRERTASWSKSRWRRHAVIRRKHSGGGGGGGRNGSVSSEVSEAQSDSPTEKMFHSSSEETVLLEDKAEPSDQPEVQDEESASKALLKRKYIMEELLDTERQYVSGLDDCINGYMKELRSPNLPDALKGKERVIFGNIQDLYTFHKTKFLGLLEAAQDSLEDIAECFLDQSHDFEIYVTYCENKPKSEAFLWTYHHSGGTYFEEIQNQLGHRQGIDSFLIKPVQRITKYQLLLRDLRKSAQKSSLDTPQLDKALKVMHDIPKRANDAMTLSMIYGYEGNIHAHGQIILRDEFTVYERTRWTAARRHIFLLDQRLVITKEKDADGLYVYKDSLKVHSLTLAEKEGDNPARFAVGTGPIGSWDQYYVLEASSLDKKQLWVQAIKDILQRQFELLKALKQPAVRGRSKTFDLSATGASTTNESVAMIYGSDDSDLEDEDEDEPSSPALWGGGGGGANRTPDHTPTRTRSSTVAEVTLATPTTSKPRPLHLYEVAEDCAPPKDNEGILYVHRGQIYDISDRSSDWWFARLVRDVGGGEDDSDVIGRQGWVPGSFLEPFEGLLSPAEKEAYYKAIDKKEEKGSPQHAQVAATQSASSSRKKEKRDKRRFGRTRSLEYRKNSEGGKGGEGGEGVSASEMSNSKVDSAPIITATLSNETVISGRSVQFKCQFSAPPPSSSSAPPPSVQWQHDGERVGHDRAFTSISESSAVLRIKEVVRSDDGSYTCFIRNSRGAVSTTAKLIVLSAPDPPSSLCVKSLTSTSVSISWAPPTFTGHSPITIYLLEVKDTSSDRWSTIMKRITEASTVVQDLMPGLEYIFRVICGNHIGSSAPSHESAPIRLARAPRDAKYSLDPFDGQYSLLREIGWGRYGVVYECLHETTQQTYAAKLLPLDVGADHAHHELEMLTRLDHPNTIQLTSAYLTDTHFVLLFPLVRGSSLLEYFVSRDCLTEPVAVGCVRQMLEALDYLHSANIAHLDIKPENVMLVEPVAGSPASSSSAVPDVKLMHFERARLLKPAVAEGTVIARLEDHIEFEAPEVLLGQPVSTATDMWSLGVVMYTLLAGTSPFLVDSRDLMKDNIVSVRFSFPVKTFRELPAAKELISDLLRKEPSKRLSPAQCHAHPWLATPPSSPKAKLSTAKLKLYVATRKWQSSLLVQNDETFSRL